MYTCYIDGYKTDAWYMFVVLGALATLSSPSLLTPIVCPDEWARHSPRSRARCSAGAVSPTHCRALSAVIPAPCPYALRRQSRPIVDRGRGSGARRAAPCPASGARVRAGLASVCPPRNATRSPPNGGRSLDGSRRVRGRRLLLASCTGSCSCVAGDDRGVVLTVLL